MDLLEYQAKELFKQVGIPVLPSQSLSSPGELKNLRIPYPVVLKSQVIASGRAKVGGVKFVSNTIDAIAASQSIFNLPIEKEYPKVILAETRYDAQNEVFLAIMLDYQLKKPVLLGSLLGGINIEELLNNLTRCIIEDHYSSFYGRHLAKQMGLEGKIIHSIGRIIDKMYQLFIERDLDIIEINPLGVGADGSVMALDGKIRVNDYGLSRHQDLLKLIQPANPTNSSLLVNFSIFELNKSGNIAVICNNIDQAIFTVNKLNKNQSKNKVNTCIIIPEDAQKVIPKELNSIFESIFANSQIAVVLADIPFSYEFNYLLIQTIKKYYPLDFSHWSNRNDERGDRPTGMRFNGNDYSKSKTSFSPRKINWIVVTTETKLQEKFTNIPITLVNRLDEKFNLIQKI